MVALSLLLEPQEDTRLKYFGFAKSSKINLKIRMKVICVSATALFRFYTL